ncbi:M24 family metallopeptidase [Halobacteriovorax sp.]|uniref:M24 family metallopeptidase n=1 Tax=Halobacteriovorax sp. TaxID=2020862 RepID=UPI00356A8EAD
MRNTFFLEKEVIEQHLKEMASYLQKNSIDAAYISSFDIFMNEYVPMQESLRYYFSGFSGSVAEVLLLSNGTCHLFVDGRYHEQADIEVEAEGVIVEKCPFGQSLIEATVDKISSLGLNSLWVDGDRTPLGHFSKFSKIVENIEVGNTKVIQNFISFQAFTKDATLSKVKKLTSANEKIRKILKEGEGMWLNSLDSISWLTNLRGYGLPFQSSFMARCFATRDGIELAIPNNYLIDFEDDFIKVHRCSIDEFSKDMPTNPSVEKIYYDPALINLTDYNCLGERFGNRNLVELKGGIIPVHAIKTKKEMEYIDAAFLSGDKAILNSLNWLKNSFHAGEQVSELDFYHKASEFYSLEGAKGHSFGTIAGFGANSSIIHYSSPSAKKFATDGEIVLMDSGAYFEGGFATDTTRTIFLGKGEASEKQKLIYTLVLKGLLNAQNAVFPEGTWGSHIDALARTPILRGGFNYAHGTGHGVGVNVHEGGLRFSPTSSIPLKEGNLGSIEPGIYLPGFGGVRLENIATVVKHPTLEGMLTFEPVVWIGFDHALIDENLMNKEEIQWLNEYEAECEKRGTLFS